MNLTDFGVGSAVKARRGDSPASQPRIRSNLSIVAHMRIYEMTSSLNPKVNTGDAYFSLKGKKKPRLAFRPIGA
jgi:hypothetical protein